ncbi:MAG TPA: hypothetical protein VEN82_05685 [Actinomycetota bacterium]|nr:hypothetical protein [Actinomycetota bacterium]
MGVRVGVRRKTTILLMVVVALSAVGPAALAKGPMVPTSGRAMISGPGLRTPIVITWKGRCFELATFACQDQPIRGDFWTLVSDAGLGGHPPASMSVISFPRPANAGPRYRVTYLITFDGTSTVERQDLFPYGPPTYPGGQSHPWFWTPYGQVAFGQPVHGGWWPATATLRTMLGARGLPAKPRVAAAPAAGAASHASPGRPWALWAGVAALFGLILAGARAGRPRGSLRAA